MTIKSNGFPFSTALLSYFHVNNVGGSHFIWKVPSADAIEDPDVIMDLRQL